MDQIKKCEGYKKLKAAVEHDEKTSPGFHDYRAKLTWAVERARHYAEKTGLKAEDVLDAWEKGRDYWYMNFYQDGNQPEIKGDAVRVFETLDDMMASVGESGFRCPRCGGVSKNPYTCDSGVVVSDIKDGESRPCN